MHLQIVAQLSKETAMEDVRKADPTFTAFVPRTAAEAVDRYVRCRKNGLKPMLVPECLIQCAQGLNEEQIELFENWIINPNGAITGKLVPENASRTTKSTRTTASALMSCPPPCRSKQSGSEASRSAGGANPLQTMRNTRNSRWNCRAALRPQSLDARLPHEPQV